MYVCAEDWGKKPLIANRAKPDIWESFDLIPIYDNVIAIRSHVNGMFVCAEEYGNKPLIANRR